MSGHILDTMMMQWRQFRISIIETWQTLNTAEIRKLSWAKHIESYDAVPDIYKFFFEALLKEGRAFPYTILTPTFEGLLQARTTEKLVCDLGNEIYVLEKTADAVRVYNYSLEEISCVEKRTVLLDSQIKIYGTAKNDLPASITIKFNTATEDLFTPIVEKIRRIAIGPEDSDPDSETAKLDSLGTLSYKFMNYARHSLLGGEKILQMILQSKIQVHLLKIFGRTYYKMISPAHLTILTDRELILIHEENNPRAIGEYGKVWDYIQLKKIVNLSLSGEDGKFPKLSIQLPEGVGIENLYQASAKQEITQLLSRFASIAAENKQSGMPNYSE